MRAASAFLPILLATLAGCSGGGTGDVPTDSDGFSDLDVQATATKGVLLGVVVDEAIRPIPDAAVSLDGGGASKTQATDGQGRFAFDDLEPGTYFLRVTALQYAPSQTSADVVAGVEDPPVVRVQLVRLFTQDPYAELIKFDGYLACAYAYGVSSTCVNDYTRLVGGTVPGCEGGCLKDHNVSHAGGNIREFRTDIGPGWQSLVMEMHWEPSAGEPASRAPSG